MVSLFDAGLSPTFTPFLGLLAWRFLGFVLLGSKEYPADYCNSELGRAHCLHVETTSSMLRFGVLSNIGGVSVYMCCRGDNSGKIRVEELVSDMSIKITHLRPLCCDLACLVVVVRSPDTDTFIGVFVSTGRHDSSYLAATVRYTFISIMSSVLARRPVTRICVPSDRPCGRAGRPGDVPKSDADRWGS